MRADSGWGGVWGAGRQPSCLGEFTAGHFCVTGKKETMETNGCGSETHLRAQIKSSYFKAARLYRG